MMNMISTANIKQKVKEKWRKIRKSVKLLLSKINLMGMPISEVNNS